MENELPQTYTSSSAWRTAASLLLYILVYYALFRDLRSILMLVIVIIIHEGGHFIAMKIFGYRDMKMFFIPFFGAFVSGKSNDVSLVQRAIMLLSGPLPGILMGLLLFALSIFLDAKNLLQPALLFIILNAINLIPVSPMDGGQFLQILFPASNKIIQTIVTLLLITVITWLAFKTRNYLLLMLDIFLFYRLSILFGEKYLEPEHPDKDDSTISDHANMPAEAEKSPFQKQNAEMINPVSKSILLLLWLVGILIPIALILYLAAYPSRFF
jgi:Zn-dependent protease